MAIFSQILIFLAIQMVMDAHGGALQLLFTIYYINSAVCLCVRPGADLGFRTSTDGQDQVLKPRFEIEVLKPPIDGHGFFFFFFRPKLPSSMLPEISKLPPTDGQGFLGFLGNGFGVKENKKAGTGELCPTVTGTH
jgi:hypothetical protein